MNSMRPSLLPQAQQTRRLQARALRAVLSCACCLLPLAAQADYRAHGEPASGNHFSYQLGNGGSINAQWPNQTLRWHYNPANQPATVNTEQMVELIGRAMQRWSDVCGLAFAYAGTTSNPPDLDATWSSTDRVSVIGWGPLTGSRTGYGAYAAYWYLNNGTMLDADVVINTLDPYYTANPSLLEGLITHEVGHMIGLQHSDVSTSIMWANPYHPNSYLRSLRSDDVAACAAVYGPSVHSSSNRMFNWAENAFASHFTPNGAVSQQAGELVYRHYPSTGNYLGVLNNTVYVLLGQSAPLAVGPLNPLFEQAVAGGF